MILEKLHAGLEPAYEAFLARRPDALFYHGLRYRDFLRAMVGGEDKYYIAHENGSIHAVLPSFWKTTPDGIVVNSLPFYGSHGSVLADDAVSAGLVREGFLAEVREPGVLCACLVGLPGQELPDGDLKDQRTGQWTPIPADDFDKAFAASIDSSARRNVSKARRAGITWETRNTPDGFALLEDIHRENMSTIGGLAKDPAFFRLIPQGFRPGEDYDLWVARSAAGEPMAAMLIFYFKDTVEYFVPGTYLRFRDEQPLPLLIWEAFRAASFRGLRWWNWGGTWGSQDGVYRFKAKWGAEDRPYEYRIFLNQADLLKRDRAYLSALAPGYYVVPYSALEAPGGI